MKLYMCHNHVYIAQCGTARQPHQSKLKTEIIPTLLNHRYITGLFVAWLLMIGSVAIVHAQKTGPAYDDFFKGVYQYEHGFFQQSITTFEAFRKEYPHHTLDESAYYYEVKAKAQIDSTKMPVYYEGYIRKYPQGSKARELLVELGTRADNAGNYDDALTYYQRALKHESSSIPSSKIYYWMAETAESKGDYDLSRKYYLTVAQKYPKSKFAPQALYARGRSYINHGDYSDASAAFELLKQKYPNDPMTRRIGTALGESYYKQKQYAKAIDALKKAIPYLDDEGTSKAVYLIAESYNYLNNFKEASNYYLRYINLNKGNDKARYAYYGLGWVYNKQGIYHWAADAFAKAAKGNDEIARKALYYKAVNEKLGGKYENALNTFREFGKKYKSGLWVQQVYYEWAVTAFQTGRYVETIETCLKLVRNDAPLKKPGQVFSLLGQAYFANNEYSRAMEAFDQAAKAGKAEPGVVEQSRFQKAWVMYQNQAYEQARPIFQDLYTQAPKSSIGKQSLFWSADCYYHLDKYGPAASQFEAFIKQYPDNKQVGAARYSLGWAYFKMGEYEKAIPPFKSFLQHYSPPPIALFPYNVDTELRIGDAYYALKDYEQAISYYQKAENSKDGGDYALYQISNCYYRGDQSYEAVTTLRTLLKKFPESSIAQHAQYNIGYIYFLTGNYEQAIDEFETVIKRYPGTSWAARAQYNIGDAYYNATKFNKAVDAYKQVLNNYPKSNLIIEAVNGIQYAQIASGKPDSSSAVLESFLSNHPQSNTADRLRFRQAENLLQSGDYKSAISSFKEYIRITNNDHMVAEAYFNLADAYEQINNIPQAIAAYQAIVDQYPKSDRVPVALLNLGRLSRKTNEYDAAIGYYQKLLGASNNYRLEALIGLGETYLSMNQPEKARDQFEKGLQFRPNSDLCQLGVGQVALQEKNYDQAQNIFSKLSSQNTAEPGARAQYYLGLALQDQNKYSDAIKEFSKVKVLYEAYANWVSEAMLHTAQCYKALNNPADETNTLKAIIHDYPGTQAAQEAQKLLKQK